MLELKLNAHLLGPEEGPAPHLFKMPDITSWFKVDVPDFIHNSYRTTLVTPIFLAAAVWIIPFLGAAAAGLELYRLYDILAHKMRRPSYYNAEATRRAARLEKQRSDSHRIRHRTSWLEPPTKTALLNAWARAHHRGAVREKLLLGAMMSVLEAAVDNSLKRDLSGEIVGRQSGMKGWLRVHCVELVPHYSTLMRYKAAADKLEAASGLSDPCPEEVLLAEPEGKDNIAITVGTKSQQENREAGESVKKGKKNMENQGEKGAGRLIAITVGMEMEGGKQGRLTLLGVREGVRKKDVEERMGYVAGCRRNARRILKEARKAASLCSFKTFDDFLYARLGLVRERRLFTPSRKKTSRVLP